MKIIRLHIIFTLIFINLSVSFSQPVIKLLISNDTVKIGENLGVKLEINDKNLTSLEAIRINMFDSLGLFNLMMPNDSLSVQKEGFPDFEITDYGLWEDHGSIWIEGDKKKEFAIEENGKIENIFKFKVWDPGQYLILVEELRFRKGDSLYSYFPDLLHGQSLLVDLPLNEGAEMAPIKNILKEGYHWSDFWWIYLGLIFILILYFFIRYIRSRKKDPLKKIKKIVVRPAHEIALEKLTHLKEENLWQSGKIKEYQSQLTHIIREYLENRFEIKALESTSSEISKALKDKGLEEEDKAMLQNILQIADLVKFAKAKPELNIHEKFFIDSIDFVNRTKVVHQKDNKSE